MRRAPTRQHRTAFQAAMWKRRRNRVLRAISTLDPSSAAGGMLSNVNRTFASNGLTANAGAQSITNKTAGKWYFEVTVNRIGGGTLGGIGAKDHAAPISTNIGGLGSHGASGYFSSGSVYVNGSLLGTMNGAGRAPQAGDVIGIGIDVDHKTITFRNWTSKGGQSPIFSMVSESDYVATVFMDNHTPPLQATLNFGAVAFVGAPFSGYSAWN